MGILLGLLLTVLLTVAFVGGIVVGVRSVTANELRRLGLSKESVKLFHRAGRLLTRIVRVTDLDGPGSVDLLSLETRTLIDAWLAEYRTQIEKV